MDGPPHGDTEVFGVQSRAKAGLGVLGVGSNLLKDQESVQVRKGVVQEVQIRDRFQEAPGEADGAKVGSPTLHGSWSNAALIHTLCALT